MRDPSLPFDDLLANPRSLSLPRSLVPSLSLPHSLSGSLFRLLSFIAALSSSTHRNRAGAKMVIGVDMSHIIHKAREIVRDNKLDHGE